MPSGFRFALRLLAAWMLIPALVVCQTAQPLDRHARKIQKTLAGWPEGAAIFVTENDGSQHVGQLGTLKAASFELVERQGNRLAIDYAAVKSLQRAGAANNDGWLSRHRHGLVVGLVTAGVLVGLLILAAVDLRKS